MNISFPGQFNPYDILNNDKMIPGDKVITPGGIIKESEEKTDKKENKNDPNYECETCKNRKYQDGSDEMVSFKTASHISPEAAASAVRAHEGEHVSNAYKKAATSNAKVVQASVTIKTSVCPECGRTYVSGGETRTQIKYYNEDNPYQKDLKTQDATKYSGKNINFNA